MKKYIFIIMLSIISLASVKLGYAKTAADACKGNNIKNGDSCTYQQISGGRGQSSTTKNIDGFCDRTNGDTDASKNPLICKPKDSTDNWEGCTVTGDACKSGDKLGVCGTRGARGIPCDTTKKPPGNPGGSTSMAQDGSSGGSSSGETSSDTSSSSSPTTTAGTVNYESYTNFPGVGRISNLCQLITALWLLGFAVLLTSVLGMFLYAGYIYVTAGVNAGKVNQAKEIFTNTITGLIIGLSIYIIINVINPGLLQGNCSIPPIGSTGTGAGQPTLGGGGGIPSAGTPCDSSNPNIKCIKPGEVNRVDITSCFYRNSNGAFHGGTDWVVAGAGNPVAILTAGQVVDVCRGSCGGFGNSVVIKGPAQGGFDLYNYSHMSSIASGIEKGMNLGKGTIVGIQGSTGSSTGVHVDTKISNCVLCKRQGSHFTKPTKVIMQYIKETYGTNPVCGCRNGCNDT